MAYKTTMTGSFFRPKDIEEALLKSETGELGHEYHSRVLEAERKAVRDQLHPDSSKYGLNWVSNAEQGKSGYTTYIPNRFDGFSRTERVLNQFSPEFFNELVEANPHMASSLMEASILKLNKIESPLIYKGEKLAREEASDAALIKKEEGAERIFIPSPSPGVITVFYPPGKVYKDHLDYLYSLSKEISKEYRAILSVDGVDLQIDAPDLAMAKSLGVMWGMDFFDVLDDHVKAINDAIKGLDPRRIRVHYCYGNYSSSHMTDPEYERVLESIVNLKVSTLVGEMANARHAGDPLILGRYTREHGWPGSLTFAVGVIDVKSPFVETPETVALKLKNVADIDEIGPERVMGGTDCGFQTFLGFENVPYTIALKKLKSLAEGARLEV